MMTEVELDRIVMDPLVRSSLLARTSRVQ